MRSAALQRLRVDAELFAAQAERRGLIATFAVSPKELLQLLDERAALLETLREADAYFEIHWGPGPREQLVHGIVVATIAEAETE